MIYCSCSDELRNLKSSGGNFDMQETNFLLETDLKSMNNGFIQRWIWEWFIQSNTLAGMGNNNDLHCSCNHMQSNAEMDNILLVNFLIFGILAHKLKIFYGSFVCFL